MKHVSPTDIQSTASPQAPPPPRMTRRERLERWADILEKKSGPIAALRQIEYLSNDMRRAYRDPNSPLTVAYEDPILRDDGLGGDTLGEVSDYFEMTNEDTHRLLCDCHYNGTMTGPGLAARLRHYARRGDRSGLWERAQAVFSSRH